MQKRQGCVYLKIILDNGAPLRFLSKSLCDAQILKSGILSTIINAATYIYEILTYIIPIIFKKLSQKLSQKIGATR